MGDLGAGSARHAAHLATRHRPAQVIAVDSSPAQTEMATDLFGHLAPRLRIVDSDVVAHLQALDGTYDVLYSVFGAVDFTDPRELLPAAARRCGPEAVWCSQRWPTICRGSASAAGRGGRERRREDAGR
ncbi:class I SAM-dependent methyltransferase [Streptomyces sp. NBC_01017]|nr:class I SAM-dependent methyltransferase [Streptomyces sp. NBC_01017]WSV35172.1 class I SAM-dependent methyltransferase [Streptomyces sp. NBC_01017]